MLLAWVIFSTVGIFMARYMKQVTEHKKICGKDAWFPVSIYDGTQNSFYI